ncbi:MAG: tetratricopeptide repeat protein [Microcystaceae cyanobacterium]
MSENSSKSKNIQKFFIIASGLAFLATMLIPMFSMFNSPQQTEQTSSTQANKNDLNAVALGYEKVLAREPDNPTALQGLAEVRLKMNDLKGAIPPLEKLTKIYPQETQLKQLLDAIKYQVRTGKKPPMAGQDQPKNPPTK